MVTLPPSSFPPPPPPDAGPPTYDAGPNYCDPEIQCAGRRCRGIISCGHGQTIDCSLVVFCGPNEYCAGFAFEASCHPGHGCGLDGGDTCAPGETP